MKVEKYIFMFPAAIEKMSVRFGVKILGGNELFVLYSLSYLPANCSQQAILRHAKRMKRSLANSSLSESLSYLSSVGFIESVSLRYTITSLGRSYLSGIRRYLVNKRL